MSSTASENRSMRQNPGEGRARCPRRAAILTFGCAICSAFLLLPLLAAGETNSFRFAWLSDTHVGSGTGEEDLRASVRDINSLTGLSFVVISGDVTEYGSREQLRLAKEILDGLKIPYHVVPGNHDTKWSESGATDFPRLWKEDRFVFNYGGFCFIGMHEGPVMKMSDGHWAPQDVRWLEETLKNLDTNQPIVFVTHYPIDDGIDNWYVVLDLLKKYNTQVALCGHIHRNRKDLFEGLPGVMGRSNLRGTAPVGGYNLVDIKDGRTIAFSERTPGGPTQSCWHSMALTKHAYLADTNKYPRPDFSINGRFPGVKERWRHDTGYTIACSPAVWKDSVIIGDASGTVYGLSLELGNVQWQFKTQSAVYSTPELVGDLAIIPSTDGNIYAVQAATGHEVWRYETARPLVASPRGAKGIVYIGSSEGKFRALEAKSGKLLWQFDRLGGFVETKPLIHEGKVIFGAWDQHLYALDARTGKLAWKWKGDRAGTLFSPAACWPVAAKDKIFIAAPDRKMTALDAQTGAQVWRTGNYMVRETIGVSEDQTRLYVRAMQDSFYALSTSARNPETLWERKTDFGYDINSAMIIEKDGMVFYGTKNGLLFALEAKTGALKWEHKMGIGVINTVVPLNATRVLAADFDGHIALVEAKE
jgi:outer membrane protein assembly factor BamB/predicted MPP superfamily phosphohydrolase